MHCTFTCIIHSIGAESRTFTVNDIKDKDAKETELAKAMEIQREIHKSEKSLRHIQKERRKLKERERETVAKLHSLKSQPGHRTDEQVSISMPGCVILVSSFRCLDCRSSASSSRA